MNSALQGYKPIFPILLVALGLTEFGCAKVSSTVDCSRGEDVAREGRFSETIDLLGSCLSGANIDVPTRSKALKIRAFAYYSLGDYKAAATDQDSAFSIQEPTEYRDFINYALYLRHAGRLEDSLRAARSAEAIEEKDGRTSMMTQYHLGWTLLELGRPNEAVEAFSRGVPYQPEYPFVYWRRGLAYEALGQKARARKDFELTAKYLASPGQEAAAGDLLPVIRAKLRVYGLNTTQRHVQH